MSASEHLHPEQLKLFMGAQEWKNTVTKSTDSAGDMDELWDRKLDEAMEPPGGYSHGAGLHASLMEHGYNPEMGSDKPTIQVGADEGGVTFKQYEGHHRIVAMANIEATHGRQFWVPTNYERDPRSGPGEMTHADRQRRNAALNADRRPAPTLPDVIKGPTGIG